MKYPITPESLAKFYKVKVNLSDKVVRNFREGLPTNKPKPKSIPKFKYDIDVIDSNGMIPMVIIERPNMADQALEAMKKSVNGSASRKKVAAKPKHPNKKSTGTMQKKPKPKQKPSRPQFVLPKTEYSKKK